MSREYPIGRGSFVEGPTYKLNLKDKELIGIQDAVLFWITESGLGYSTGGSGTSGLDLVIFDTTSRADSAQIKLLNDSAATQYVIAAAIKAKPVFRTSGEQGFVHDSFVDFQDIFYNGENLFEFGNNFVVTKDQLEKLADYYAKALGVNIGADAVLPRTTVPKNKHLYTVTIPGRCWWYEPGEWYLLQIGGAGQREYIDSVVECYSVQVEMDAGGLGSTSVSFREVEQNWVKDSNAIARFLATGDPKWKPNNFGRVVVAARDYMGVADYYCDGTADQVEIQAAVDHLAGTGGGLVELTEGQFNTTSVLIMQANIILRGKGFNTIISKNCNDYVIEIDTVNDATIENLTVTQIDTESQPLIFMNAASGAVVQEVQFYAPYYAGIRCDNSKGRVSANIFNGANISRSAFTKAIHLISCDDFIVENNTIRDFVFDTGSVVYLIYGQTGRGGIIIKNQIFDITSYGNTIVGIRAQDYTKVQDNSIRNIRQWYSFFSAPGIWINADNVIVTGNRVEENTDVGIYIASGAENTGIANNFCKDNGELCIRGYCESATVPAILGESANTLVNCTFARSATRKYGGTYSYLGTKTAAAGTAATCYLTDNVLTTDLHGLYAGQQYRLGAWVYIPSGAMLGSELSLVIRDYVAAWAQTAVACALTYDAWQYVEVTRTLLAGAVAATFGFSVAAAAAINETFYIDNLRLTPMGTGNLHNQNYYDAGSFTYTGV